MTLNTYGHVFEEFEGGERRSAEEQMRRARQVGVRFVSAGGSGATGPRQHPCKQEADARIRTGDPFITSESCLSPAVRCRAL
jgi:hypothetical protein